MVCTKFQTQIIWKMGKAIKSTSHHSCCYLCIVSYKNTFHMPSQEFHAFLTTERFNMLYTTESLHWKLPATIRTLLWQLSSPFLPTDFKVERHELKHAVRHGNTSQTQPVALRLSPWGIWESTRLEEPNVSVTNVIILRTTLSWNLNSITDTYLRYTHSRRHITSGWR